MTKSQTTWTMDATELACALRELIRLGGQTPGPAIWRARSGTVSIEFKGGRHELSAKGPQSELAFRVSADVIRALAVSRAAHAAFVLTVEGDEVLLDGMRLPLIPVRHDLPTNLLGVDVGPLEVLLAAERHSEEEIANAGLRPAVDAARAQLEAAARRAAAELGWLQLDADGVARLLEVHVRETARRRAR